MSPRCGHAYPHPRTTGLAEPLLIEIDVGRNLGDENLGGHPHGGLLVVQLLENPIHEIGAAERHDLVEDESAATHDPPATNEEDLDRRLEIVVGQPDHVDVVSARADHLLFLDGPPHAVQPVAVTGGELELVSGSRVRHARLQIFDDTVGVPFQEPDEVGDEALIVRVADLSHARTRALLDVEQQARSPLLLVPRQLGVRTRADGECSQEEVEGLADGVGVAEGPEVANLLATTAPHDHGAWPLVADGDGEERVALVVDQTHVETRPVGLDEAVLQHQRLDLVGDLDPLETVGGRHHLGGTRVQRRGVGEVVGDAGTEALGLSDVDHPTLGVLELIAAGRVGNRSTGRSRHHGPNISPSRRAAPPAGNGRGGVGVGTNHRPPTLWRDTRRRVSMPTATWRTNMATPVMLRLQEPLDNQFVDAPPEELERRIAAAKKALGDRLFILGHHYQRDEVIRWSDARGDSFMLAQLAMDRPNADYIVFCGVHFMAEAADILTQDHQKVILPDLNAGCSMADMADIDSVEEAWEDLAEITDIERVVPITYMNSEAKLKAFVGEHGGAVCTSSNARPVLEWAFERGDKVLFFPDQHLGRNTGFQMGFSEDDMAVWDPRHHHGGLSDPVIRDATFLLWKGHCSVHQRFQPSHVEAFRNEYPDGIVIVHPECSHEVCELADQVGSTNYIVNAVAEAPAGSVIGVGTEIHMVNRLRDETPDKTVMSLDPLVCPCSTMFRIDAPHLCWVLENLVEGRVVNQISVDADTTYWAKVALERMLDIT